MTNNNEIYKYWFRVDFPFSHGFRVKQDAFEVFPQGLLNPHSAFKVTFLQPS